MRERQKAKYDINSSTCIFIVSGNTNDLGKVITLNNDVKKLYEFNNKELIGAEVTKIMPPVYEKLHEQFLTDFFEENVTERNHLNHERLVYAISKRGYLVPSSLMIKVMPDLEDGNIRIVGFLSHDPQFERVNGM